MTLRIIKHSLSARLFSSSTNGSLAEKLSNLTIAKYLGNINELLSISPELNKYPPEQWETSFNTLKKLGFNSQRFAQIISQHPRILIKSEDKIELATNQWRAFNFGEKQTYQLLERYPELLEVKNFHLANSNIGVINSFVGQKNGYKVLRNSPNIATEQTEMLKEKVNYLKDVMKVDPVEVYKSDVFSYDLLKIKTRHIFLERLGMYFKRKKANDDNEAVHEFNKNPKLSKIVDTSDKRFATKVCHVTLEEYETFEDMYREELNKTGGRYREQSEEFFDTEIEKHDMCVERSY